MRMDEIGWHHIHDAAFYNIRPEGAGDWLLLLIKSPCRVDGEAFPAGTMILYTSKHPQDYGADGTQYIDDWMHFEPDTDERKLLEKLQIPLNTPVTLKNSNALSKLLREINFEFYSAHQFRQEIVDLQFKCSCTRLQNRSHRRRKMFLRVCNGFTRAFPASRLTIFRQSGLRRNYPSRRSSLKQRIRHSSALRLPTTFTAAFSATEKSVCRKLV